MAILRRLNGNPRRQEAALMRYVILFVAVLAAGPARATTPVGFGDRVAVNKATLACPKLSDMRRVMELASQQDMQAARAFAERQGCRQILERTVGVVEKSGRPKFVADCLRPQGEPDCFWIMRLRLTVIKKAVWEPVDYDPFGSMLPPTPKATELAPASGPFPAVTSSQHSTFSVGAQVKVKLPALACPNRSDFRRIVELTIEKDTEGLQKFSNSSGCRQFSMGTVAAVEQEDTKEQMVCIRTHSDVKCLWTSPSGLLSRVN
jgi:hypothetical protein